jgi:hypothetical protein
MKATIALASALFTASLAQGAVLTYVAALTGAAEAPPNLSLGVGTTSVTYDNLAHTLHIVADFSGLTGTTTNAHIHCCTAAPLTGTAGVATTTPSFVGFPLGVTAGLFDNTLNLTLASSWNSAFVTSSGSIANAETLLAAGLNAGTTYLNIHTSAVGAGEIRGFLVPTPEPSTALLMLVPAVAFWMRRRGRRS